MKVSKFNFFLDNKWLSLCDLIEKFECAGKFTMCGNNVTRKYWLIADRPNKAKKCGPFSPLVQILWGREG